MIKILKRYLNSDVFYNELKPKTKLILRASIGVGIPFVVISGLLILYFFGSYETGLQGFPCAFKLITHLDCPGCGSSRATYSLLNLNLLRAFSFNPFFVISLPFIAYYFVTLYLRFVFNYKKLPVLNVSHQGVLITVLVIVLAFWILRNIPVPPFIYLSSNYYI